MKVSEHWLRQWVDPPLSTAELAEKLTMSGLEVASIEPAAPAFSGVVVGEVLSLAPHPNAQKLKVCQVNIGQAAPLTIVCGAANVSIGMKAPTALIGGQLPGLTLQAATIRGADSQGMLCSARELGLSEDATGLLALPSDAPVGKSVWDFLDLTDVSITVDLTPNRGDCLSIQGLAREISALTGFPLKKPAINPIPDLIPDSLPVDILNPVACPRYVGRIIKGARLQTPTPLWMRERLRRSGLRSINIVVDITNYVLLELGQPMHAFDLRQLKGGIRVRNAAPGETLTLLDGRTIALEPETLVIADHAQVLALAGVMGGEHSGVSEQTEDIFFESAYFSPLALAGSARRYGLQTDSSYRFERGVDPQLQRLAIERATALLLEISGGQPGIIEESVSPEHLPTPPLITLRAARIQRILGESIAADQLETYLNRLGLKVTTATVDSWQASPPSFRFDLSQEIDLIEELARLHGYSRLGSELPLARLMVQPSTPAQRCLPALQAALVQRGYQEVITYSFVDPSLQQKLDPQGIAIALANPLAQEMAVMRATLWTGLLATLMYNHKRQQPRLRLFESGLRFRKNQDGSLFQQPGLAGVAMGTVFPEQWGIPAKTVDFFDLKNDAEALLQVLGLPANTYRFIVKPHPALHPGQSAAIARADAPETIIGWLGGLHPAIAHQLELSEPVYLFELELLCQQIIPQYQPISRFPSIRRDIAIVVDEKVTTEQVCDCIRQSAGDLLAQLQLFDQYRGKGIDPDKKSLALGLTFRAISRNLTEQEINVIMAWVIKQLAGTLHALQRVD